jgi:adenine-specific DNA methylase
MTRRLIEVAFPLKQASLDSVHEKNVRHGHISTLHIWPARRPLAACRAALIATLLPDPGTPEERRKLCEKIGGRVVERTERKKMPSGREVDVTKEETVGGILHWGRETDNKRDVDWFREEIRKAYGGRAPRVLDPFAGGGAIPLEAMRLGCDVTAVDINPVAWFILKCTLEYPQKLAGQKRPLPDFILKDEEFMEAFFKANPGAIGSGRKTTSSQLELLMEKTQEGELPVPEADLAWHVRAWGRWVLARARRELAPFYPVYADFEPLKRREGAEWERRPMQLVPLREDGTPDLSTLNAEFNTGHLSNALNPRWVAKSTVAYLWARTVTCKNCRATLPLLKTRWLCKKANKRVLLTMESLGHGKGVRFGIDPDVPARGGNAAQKREHDKRIGAGTMSRSGATCPCCNSIMTMEDIRLEGQAGRLGATMTAVVVDRTFSRQEEEWRKKLKGREVEVGKEYRLPTEHELAVLQGGEEAVKALEIETLARNADQAAGNGANLARSKEERAAFAANSLDSVETSAHSTTDRADIAAKLREIYARVLFGLPVEPTPIGASRATGGSPFTVHIYGMTKWHQLLSPRQLSVAGMMCSCLSMIPQEIRSTGYAEDWVGAITCFLAAAGDRLSDYNSRVCNWDPNGEYITHTFQRFALPIKWDFSEINPFSGATGDYSSALEWVTRFVGQTLGGLSEFTCAPTLVNSSAITSRKVLFDAIITDPPYYDAIPYSDLMDFFYLWLRRTLSPLSADFADAFRSPLGPKWDAEEGDGELIDDSSRFGGDRRLSKQNYEDGMARVFRTCGESLTEAGALVVVFANKQPDAWETLVAALIRSGFLVDGSWPIQTEMGTRTRAQSSAALASSVWLVCKRRPATARPGWDTTVLQEMREKIGEQLRDYWDAGIRGPDFVWAATGPALEAYSKHPVVKKANTPGAVMTVSEFLGHARRLVVDFVVGRVLSMQHGSDVDISGLDAVTTYYLLHRHDFGMDDSPIGPCILYAVSCGLSDSMLADQFEILQRTGGQAAPDEEDDDESGDDPEEVEDGTGSQVRLRPWAQRKRIALAGAERVLTRVREGDAAQESFLPEEPAAEKKPRAGRGEKPLIDHIHGLMHLWKAGEVVKVDDYLDAQGLRRSALFAQVLQAVIELSQSGGEERSILESISNHLRLSGVPTGIEQSDFLKKGDE